jgi:hypothetical protein
MREWTPDGIDWERLDDDELLDAACELTDCGRLPPPVLALLEAVLLTPPGGGRGHDPPY